MDAESESFSDVVDTDWWSLQPILQPDVPELNGGDLGWVENPIDAFVIAKLREQQLSLSPEADPSTLIRRVYFDLIRLPPSPDEVDAFIPVAATGGRHRV